MTDVAALGLSVDSSQVTRSTVELRAFEQVAKRTGETIDQVVERFGRLTGATKENASVVEKASPAARSYAFQLGVTARGLLSMIPTGAALAVGFGLAEAAARKFFATGEDADRLNASLKIHESILKQVQEAYRRAADEAGKFQKEQREILQLQTQQNLLMQQYLLMEQARSLVSNVSTPRSTGLMDAPLPPGTSMSMQGIIDVDANFSAFKAAIEAFNASVEAGKPQVEAYRLELARIGLAAAESNPKLAAQANALLTAAGAAGELAHKIRQTEAMIRLMNGTANAGDRGLLGLKDNVAKTVNEYDRLDKSLDRRMVSLEAEAQAAGRGVYALESLRTQQQLLLAAEQAKIKLTPQLIEAINKRAEAYGRAAEAAARTRLQSDLMFERDQLFRTDMDQRIASQLRSSGLPVDFNSYEAGLIRINEQLRLSRDLTMEFVTTFTSEFRSSLRNGEGFWEAFANAGVKALNRIADRLTDIALQELALKAFGGSGMSNVFSFLSPGGNAGGSFTNYGTGPAGAIANPFAWSGIAHGGGIAGQLAQGRWVHAAHFNDAPRFHAGLSKSALGINEVPVIAKRGELIGWPQQMQQAFGGSKANSQLSVRIVNEGPPVEVTGQRYNEDGELELTMRGIVRDEMASPRTNGITRQKYGQSPMLRTRT